MKIGAVDVGDVSFARRIHARNYNMVIWFQKLVFPEGIPYHRGVGFGTARMSLFLQTKTALRDGESLLVTPRRAVMNYLKQARELMPVMMGWNGEVARFLERPRGVQTLAVTY